MSRSFGNQPRYLVAGQKAVAAGQDIEFVAPKGLIFRVLRWLPFNSVSSLAMVGDFFVIIPASVISGIGYHWFFLHTEGNIDIFFALGALVSVNFSSLTAAQNSYSPVNLINIAKQLRQVTLNWLCIFAVLTALGFILKIADHFSRGATLSFFFTGWMGLILFRTLLSKTLAHAWRAGAFSRQEYILIVERGQSLKSSALAELYRCGYRPIKILEYSASELDSSSVQHAITQVIGDTVAANGANSISCVFLMLKWMRTRQISNLVQHLHSLPIPVYLLPDEYVGPFLAAQLQTVGTAHVVPLQRAPLTASEQKIKRIFDFIIAAAMIVILSPLMLIITLAIRLESDGPALFKQRRRGFSGSNFFIYKFRTMHVLEDGEHIVQARKNDPRVTPLGFWLRRTSVDELPQLLNVLRGEMSLVGPRPHALAHDSQYENLVANYACRHNMKPGITGWAQVCGLRGETPTVGTMAKRIEYDLWYIDHWSFWLDLRIVLKTLVLAFRQPQAY